MTSTSHLKYTFNLSPRYKYYVTVYIFTYIFFGVLYVAKMSFASSKIPDKHQRSHFEIMCILFISDTFPISSSYQLSEVMKYTHHYTSPNLLCSINEIIKQIKKYLRWTPVFSSNSQLIKSKVKFGRKDLQVCSR